jgi:hypothetical protein
MAAGRRVLDAPHRTDAETAMIAASSRSAATGKARDARGIRGETSQTALVNVESRTGVTPLAASLGPARRSVLSGGVQGQATPRRAAGLTGARPEKGVTDSMAAGTATGTGTATAPAAVVGTEATERVAVKRIAARANRIERAGRKSVPAYGRSRRAGSGRIARSTRRCRTT